MKEKIYQYLQTQEQGVSASDLLEIFFHTFTTQSPKMGNIIDSLLQDDPRFVRDQQGAWRARAIEQNFKEAVFSIVEFLTLPFDKKNELPILLGIAQIKNSKKIFKKIFKIEPLSPISTDLRQKIEKMQQNEGFDGNILDISSDFLSELSGTILFSSAPAKTLDAINLLFSNFADAELRLPRISLKKLAKKLYPGLKFSSLEKLADQLHLTYNAPLTLSARLDLMSDVLALFLKELEEYEFSDFQEFEKFVQEAERWVDFSNYEFNSDFIKDLPATPGVYFFYDQNDKIFYVGKAKNLQRRVSSYFVNRTDMDEKGKIILAKVKKISFRLVGSELEALLVENQAIHDYSPSLNVQIKIHSFHVDKYKRKPYILFLPAAEKEKVKLFFLQGTTRSTSFVLGKDENNLHYILEEKVTDYFFSSDKEQDSQYSSEQIEIIWRWFEANKKYVNYLDVSEFSGAAACAQAIIEYLNDDELFSSHIFYVES